MFKEEDAIKVSKLLNFTLDKFSISDFVIGLNIELEHGTRNINTNVTDDDLEKTAKIALAHLEEFPDYYNPEYGLPAFEKMLEERKTQV
jgi:hypothetical protein